MRIPLMKFSSMLVLLLTVLALPAAAQNTVRVVVQLADNTPFETFERDYVEDARTRTAPGQTYHKRGVVGAAMALERKYGFQATHFYSQALNGFAATVPAGWVQRLQQDPLVKSVEIEDFIALEPLAEEPPQIVPWGIPKIGGDINSTRAGDGAGAVGGVLLYIVDTGIEPAHPDLNVLGEISFVSGPAGDCNGHGTGVAGVAAARDNSMYSVGVAPGAPLVSVKVFTCEGLTLPSIVIQAVDWLTANAPRPGVINLSLGSAIPIDAQNTAVRNAASRGLVVAVAAGNGSPLTGEPLDACLTSPAGAGYLFGIPNGVITTAATDIDDREASFSNYGVCVDLWAPGVAISSTWLLASGGMITASGTSFSSPYVAGAAALILSRYPTLPPWAVEYVLQQTAEATGTSSKDGRAIRRLSVKLF